MSDTHYQRTGIHAALILASTPVGLALKSVRTQAELTQESLAADITDASGFVMDQRRVSDHERGVRRPMPGIALKAWLECCGVNHRSGPARGLAAYNDVLDWFYHLRHFVGSTLGVQEFLQIAETLVFFAGESREVILDSTGWLKDQTEASLLRRIADQRNSF